MNAIKDHDFVSPLSYQYSWRSNKASFADIPRWILQGFKLFRERPLQWLVLISIFSPVVFMLNILMRASFLGYVLGLVFCLAFIFFYYTVFNYCAHLQYHRTVFSFEKFIKQLRSKFKGLVVVGLIATFWILIMLLLSFLIWSFIGTWQPEIHDAATEIFTINIFNAFKLIMGISVFIVLCLPVVVAIMFAPQHMLLCGLDPVNAIRASYSGCIKNAYVLLVYTCLLIAFFLLTSILPNGFGLMIFMPITFMNAYFIFKTIYSIE